MMQSSMKARLQSETGAKTESIIRWNVAGAFLSPNGITFHWNCPVEVTKAVFHRSEARTGTRWKAESMSSLTYSA